MGVARIGGLQVTVRRKVPIDRLVFMMGYAEKPEFWRDQSVLLDSDLDLADALAESFRRLATKALEQGLLHGYRSVDDALPVLRGRIRVGDQIHVVTGSGFPSRSATTSSRSTLRRTSFFWPPRPSCCGCRACRSLCVVRCRGCGSS